MIKKNKIKNNGDNSGTIIGENKSGTVVINYGVPFEQLAPYLHSLVAQDLERFKADAFIEAQRRNTEFVNDFITKVTEQHLQNKGALRVFQDPSMQFDFQEAQKGYIKNNTPELRNMLTDTLIKRINNSDNDLLQIVLSEAITVIPKLLPAQMAILGLAFIFEFSRKTILSLNDFVNYVRKEIIPLVAMANNNITNFAHINYSGCSQTSLVKKELSKYFQEEYKGLFVSGIKKEDIPTDEKGTSLLTKYPAMFSPCLTNHDLLQVSVIDEDYFPVKFLMHNVSANDCLIFKDLFFTKQRMDISKVRSQIELWVPEIRKLYEYWDSSRIGFMRLTSAGIVVGSMYVEEVTGEKYDLSIWIK